MLPLDDPRWATLTGGYGVPEDFPSLLRRHEEGEDVWDELWQELHHQGDLGVASYAAVPHLVRIARARASRDYNLYALASTIEIERYRKTNPELPDWLDEGYCAAWQELLTLALRDVVTSHDPHMLRSILGAIALANGERKLGAFIAYADQPEINEYLEDRDAWSAVYNP